MTGQEIIILTVIVLAMCSVPRSLVIAASVEKRKLRNEFNTLEIGTRYVLASDKNNPFDYDCCKVEITGKSFGNDGKSMFVEYKYLRSGGNSTMEFRTFNNIYTKL